MNTRIRQARASTKRKTTRVRRSKEETGNTVERAVQFALYEHQAKARDAFLAGAKRMFLPWHRRAGKDAFCASLTSEDMKKHPAAYWHMFPFHAQGRRALWNGIDARTGERYIDRYFPPSQRLATNQTEMLITMEDGSTWQVLGSDNYERMIGSNVRGIVFSEWALSDPNAWAFIRPILVENDGWAIFNTTFRGRNHAYKLYEQVKNLPNWYCDLRTIDDTKRHDGSPIVSREDVEREIREGMSPALAQQEFYCDPLQINEGAYFAKQYDALPRKRIITADRSFQCAAWTFTKTHIAVAVYQPLLPAITAIHTYEGVEFSTAMDRFRAHHPRTMHHFVAKRETESVFEGVHEARVSTIEVHQSMFNRQARVGWLLNNSDLTEVAQASLTDVLMEYTIDNVSKDKPVAAVAAVEALAIAGEHAFQDNGSGGHWGKPVDNSIYDRGVI